MTAGRIRVIDPQPTVARAKAVSLAADLAWDATNPVMMLVNDGQYTRRVDIDGATIRINSGDALKFPTAVYGVFTPDGEGIKAIIVEG